MFSLLSGMQTAVLVLSEQGIAEAETHAQLLEKNGLYAKFYHMQFGQEN
jgi:ABC-type multidrug transport system fused ATPase/permease subunit